MSQIFDPVPTPSDRLLCCYVNESSTIQIVRITDVPNWYFERVVFPTQRLVFEAVTIAHLEIHTGMMASSILSDTIPCVELTMVNEVPSQITSQMTSQMTSQVSSYEALTSP